MKQTGTNQTKRNERLRRNRNRGVFFRLEPRRHPVQRMLQIGQVIDKQKIVKKDKEKDENLLKNTVCKRLTYDCGNGILQEKEM